MKLRLAAAVILMTIFTPLVAMGGKTDAEVVEEQLDACRKVLDHLGSPRMACPATDPVSVRERWMEDRKAKLCTGRRSIQKFCGEFTKSMSADTVVTAVGAVVSSYCIRYVMNTGSTGTSPTCTGGTNSTCVATRGGNSDSTGLMAFHLQSALSGVITGAIKGTVTAWQNCTVTPAQGVKDLYRESKKASADALSKFPSDLRDQVEKLDKETEILLNETEIPSNNYGGNSGGSGSPSLYDRLMNALTIRELIFLSFGHAPKDISTGAPLPVEEKEKQATAVRQLLDDYPEHRMALGVLIDQIRNTSSPSVVTPKRPQLFLYGAPGVGKTTFAKRLAESIGLHFCEISVRELQTKDLLGDPFKANEQKIDPLLVLGKLGECYRRAGSTNFVLLLDEIGDLIGEDSGDARFQESDQRKELKAFLKSLTDRGTKVLPLAFRGIKADFSRVTVIGTGNKPIQNEALLERFQQFEFTQLLASQKAKALREGYYESFHNIQKQVSSEQLVQIENTTSKYLEFILEEDKKRFPGGRVIKDVVDELVTLTKSHVLSQTELKDEDIKKFIIDAFNRRRPLPVNRSVSPVGSEGEGSVH